MFLGLLVELISVLERLDIHRANRGAVSEQARDQVSSDEPFRAGDEDRAGVGAGIASPSAARRSAGLLPPT
jgi:hypothetical protein